MSYPPHHEPLNPYEVDELSSVPAPNLPGEVVIRRDEEEVIEALAGDLYIHALNCVRSFGDFHIALSGDRTTIPLYRRLMLDPAYRQIPWRRTHLWLVQEKCVPFDHEDSHWRIIREIIGDHADIPPVQLHPVFSLSPTADREYEKTLKETLAWREKGHDRLDYVLLTPEEQTVVTYPSFSDSQDDRNRFVRFHERDSDNMHHDRVCMTLKLITAARFIAVYANGNDLTSPAVKNVHPALTEKHSVRSLKPLQGELVWYMDEKAAWKMLRP